MEQTPQPPRRAFPVAQVLTAIALVALFGAGLWYWNFRLGGASTTPDASKQRAEDDVTAVPQEAPLPDHLEHSSAGGLTFTYRTRTTNGVRISIEESTTSIRTVTYLFPEDDRTNPLELYTYRRLPRMTTEEYLNAVVRNAVGAGGCPQESVKRDPVDTDLYRLPDASGGTALCPFFDGIFREFPDGRIVFVGTREPPLWSPEEIAAWVASMHIATE
jgi:hypothetical protein